MSSSTSSPNHAINPNANASRPRRGHRRRISALRLSTDTTTSLPEYISADAGWSNHQHQYHHGKTSSSPSLGLGLGLSRAALVEEEEDRPPDYPDSAEEADEDTDTDNTNVVYVPQPTHANPPLASPYLRPQTTSPRRSKKFFPTYKRRNYSVQAEQSDPYLDSLLERSVHALEMSNTLLQSSISTQSSLSTILASDSRADSYLEARAVGLSSRIRDTWDVKATWANDLEEISRDVEGLFLERSGNVSPTPISAHPAARARLSLEAGSTSCSLPNTSPLNTMPRSLKVRRPSLELRQSTEPVEAVPRLHYSQQSRSNLVSPPPRPLTQYVASSQDAESILLPSTVGIRSPAPSQPTPDWRPISNLASASSSTTSLLLNHAQSQPSTLPPQLTDKPLEPSTPAYNMLSSFVYRPAQTNGSSGSATPSTSYTPSFRPRRRDSSNASNESSRSRGTVRRRSSHSPAASYTSERTHRSLDRRSSASSGTTPKRGVSPSSSGIRPMTPTIEIEEQSSSSSSDGPVAKLTVQSLRKILDDQPTVPASSAASSTAAVNKLRAPAFMPRSPAPLPEASTSNATASISRLFTKGKHSSSTRAASPPRQSAMKRPSAPSSAVHSPAPSLSMPANLSASTSALPSKDGTPPLPSSPSSPSHNSTTLSIPELVTKMLSKSTGHSPSSSGQSTPSSAKRISFAELPESYASTRPPSSRFTKGNKGKKKGGSKGKGKADSDDVNPSSWWTGWLGPANYGGTSGMHGLGMSFERHEERLEDRQTRNWAGRMNAGYGGGLDEWAV